MTYCASYGPVPVEEFVRAFQQSGAGQAGVILRIYDPYFGCDEEYYEDDLEEFEHA